MQAENVNCGIFYSSLIHYTDTQVRTVCMKNRDAGCDTNSRCERYFHSHGMSTKPAVYERVLTPAEVTCFFKLNPGPKLAIQNQGIPLNAKAANYAWNYYAQRYKDLKTVQCKGSDGKYSVTLTPQEASCYWKKYPQAAQDFKNLGIPLDTKSASFSWNNYANKFGELRLEACEDMKTQYYGERQMIILL